MLIPTLGVGGAEIDLVRNLPHLDRSRFKVIVHPFLSAGKLAPALTAAGIEVLQSDAASPTHQEPATAASFGPRSAAHRLARRAFATIADTAWMARKVARIARHIRDDDIDVVHTILPNAYLLGSLANAVAGRRPLAMSRLSLNWYHVNSSSYRIAEAWLLHPRVDVAIGNCDAVLSDLRHEGIAEAKLRRIYNGIDVAAYSERLIDRGRARRALGISDKTLVFSVVANLHRYKGHADLLRALGIVRRHVPDVVLLAAGRDIDGNMAALCRLRDELALSEQVRFLGERDDVPAVLSAADIHISASHTEACPNNVIEAMCARLPVIATAVGGVPEQVVDSETGLLVAVRDHAALAAAMTSLAADEGRRRTLGEAGRRRVAARFPIERSVAAFENVYEALARHRRGPPNALPSADPAL